MKQATANHRLSAPRAGFTLIELLVVMTILAILAGISFVGVGAALNSGRETETETVLRLCDGVLRERASIYESLIVDNRPRYKVSQESLKFGARFSAAPANGGVLPAGATTYYARKALYASVFPQRFADLCGFDGVAGVAGGDDDGDGNVDTVSGLPDLEELGLGGRNTDDPPTATAIRNRVVGLGPTVVMANHTANTESSELLYLCITTQILPDLPFLTPDQIPASFTTDSDNDGLPELIDGWDNPIRFYTSSGGLLRGNAVAGGATEWTWDTATVRPDIPVDRAAIALVHLGNSLGFSTPPSTAILGTAAATAQHPANRDAADRFNSTRSPLDDGSTGGLPANSPQFQLLATGFDIANVTGTGADITVAGRPYSLGTGSVSFVVSAGPDGILGLVEPTVLPTDADWKGQFAAPLEPFSLGSSPALDNLTSLQGGP